MTDAVRHVLDRFDFARVHKVMVALDWRWVVDPVSFERRVTQAQGVMEVPTIEQLRKEAEHLLDMVDRSGDTYSASCGGFRASRRGDALVLEFVISSEKSDLSRADAAAAP